MRAKLVLQHRRVLTLVVGAGLGAVWIFSGSKWEETPVVADAIFLVGAVAVGAATAGRLWCSLYISGYKKGTLITCGPYSLCRNPLYFFSLLGGVGVGLATETLGVPLVILLLFAAYYPAVIREEERELARIHGDQYLQYCAATSRFWPRLSALKEPETYLVHPRVFRRHLFDSMWFVWLLGVLELVETLHEYGLVPTWLRLY